MGSILERLSLEVGINVQLIQEPRLRKPYSPILARMPRSFTLLNIM